MGLAPLAQALRIKVMKFLRGLLKRKVMLGSIIVVIIAAGYFIYKSVKSKDTPPQYVTQAAQTGTLTVLVSGTGQVATSNQVDIKPQASGKAINVPVTEGQEVQAGALLAQLDATDALKAVRDAQVNLDSAKLSLQKLQQPPDALSLLQAQNALDQARQSKQSAEDNLNKAYDNTFNSIANTFLDLPGIISECNNILYSGEIGQAEPSLGKEWNISNLMNTLVLGDRDKFKSFQDSAEADYKTARQKYDQAFLDYKNASRYSDRQTLEALLNETLDTTKSIAQAVKSQSNYLDAWADSRTLHGSSIFAKVKTYQSDLTSFTGQTSSHLSDLSGLVQSIQSGKDGITNAGQSVAEKTESLSKLEAGADPLDVQSQQLSLKQRQNALTDAQEKLADYSVRAPFAGTVAKLNVKKYDDASSGTAIATLITKQKIAQISLNEVDSAKIRLGQKAILTFDALDGLSISGEVAQIDAIGTVSQNVVSYNAQIVFDTQDDRVKSGMSVSANIITEAKTDVLLVPGSAVKSQGAGSYVEILENGAVRRQTVETGLSNDTSVEITSGLQAGGEVITQTVASGQASAQPAQSQRAGGGLIPGLGGGGGAFRALGR